MGVMITKIANANLGSGNFAHVPKETTRSPLTEDESKSKSSDNTARGGKVVTTEVVGDCEYHCSYYLSGTSSLETCDLRYTGLFRRGPNNKPLPKSTQCVCPRGGGDCTCSDGVIPSVTDAMTDVVTMVETG